MSRRVSLDRCSIKVECFSSRVTTQQEITLQSTTTVKHFFVNLWKVKDEHESIRHSICCDLHDRLHRCISKIRKRCVNGLPSVSHRWSRARASWIVPRYLCFNWRRSSPMQIEKMKSLSLSLKQPRVILYYLQMLVFLASLRKLFPLQVQLCFRNLSSLPLSFDFVSMQSM